MNEGWDWKEYEAQQEKGEEFHLGYVGDGSQWGFGAPS